MHSERSRQFFIGNYGVGRHDKNQKVVLTAITSIKLIADAKP
jgi:hypothetical protein